MKILDAYKLAAQLHAAQLDKAGRPYIEHLSRVFARTVALGGDRTQQIAALLHDSIEDKRALAGDLLHFGVPQEAVDLVLVLTHQAGESYEAYLGRVSLDSRALLVKRADLDDNSDPERLAKLPPEKAAKLAAKYSAARRILAGVL